MSEKTKTKMKMMDGCEAAATNAYRLNEVMVIYPITPSSPMGEFADSWAAGHQPNLWGKVPEIQEMQSEAGAIGAVHGSLVAGCVTTTFTASQGLLLMIPNMYKIAGELTPFVLHVAARTLATHALSIFGDHSDVMACRQTGFAMLASNNVQEAHDFAAVAHYASFKSRVPFLHFFDGFRTSHEVNKINVVSNEALMSYVKDLPKLVADNALTPDNPRIKGTAQNPDVFFQTREASNPFYNDTVKYVKEAFDNYEKVSGRKYGVIEYVGAPDAEKVMVIMGSGAETAEETVKVLNGKGEKLGVIKVRLYRPFPAEDFINAIPAAAKMLYVMDRTKEAGAIGEPLYLDVVAALSEAGKQMKVLGGRYGLSSKEFTPAMVKGVFENKDKNHFTVGITDDVTHLSIPYDTDFDIEEDDVSRCVFFGLGADGTVGANKNSIKIIAGDGDRYGQAYFVYDSKKSGAMTTSHLRFSKHPIKAPYLIKTAKFVAIHHFPFIDRLDMLSIAASGATVLINVHHEADKAWDYLPKEVQKQIIDKKLKVYVIDAVKVANDVGMGRRINTIMQACFFALSGIMPQDEAIQAIKDAIKKTYGAKGDDIVQSNYKAVDAAIGNMHEMKVPTAVSATRGMMPGAPEGSSEFLKNVTGKIIEGKGDDMPVSAFKDVVDGTWPTGTTAIEKRKIATEIPVWNPALCIQCAKCASVCPHAAVRAKIAKPEDLKNAPEGFKSTDYRGKEFEGRKYIIQCTPDDCTGCTLCHQVCPGKSKENPNEKALMMKDINETADTERKNFEFFEKLPEIDKGSIDIKTIRHSQILQPLMEYSGACAGCGETPYIKMITQLFGDRLFIANATGCSSIYGGNLPTTPYAKTPEGKGPAWANSLFEDNAEFGLGMRYAVDFKVNMATQLLKELSGDIGEDLVKALIEGAKSDVDEAAVKAQQARVKELKDKLASIKSDRADLLKPLADYLVKKVVWIIGGDGWAYDIGYGGLDHVLHSGKNINILVMDTEVYSNTGGQASKATPIGASAKFAAAGKEVARKDLGAIAMSSRGIYVAQIALGANDAQTLRAIREAESFDGPSLVIAYSHCIAHGYDLAKGLDHQKLAVETGLWPLYRFDPRNKAAGKPTLQLDSAAPSKSIRDLMMAETRFKVIAQQDQTHFDKLVQMSEESIRERRAYLEKLAAI